MYSEHKEKLPKQIAHAREGFLEMMFELYMEYG